jgi:hypothetical protein
MRIAIAWSALVVLIGGCGGDDGGGRPGVSTSESTVCDDVADVACYNLYQCCSEGEIEAFLGVSDPRSEDECRDDVRTICERQLVAFNFSIKNKRVQFDAKVMDTCLQAIEAPSDSCVALGATTPWTEACMQSAWVGTVATGGACDFAYECTTDNVCSASRICTALPGDGKACVESGCATGLFCDIGICHPLRAEGGMCASNAQCQKGLFCDTFGARTCAKLHATGEKCTGDFSCDTNTCLPGTCAGAENSCFASTGCSPHCADGSGGCTTDPECGSPGTCSLTQTPCGSPVDCAGVGNTCVFPVKCLPAECVGDIVCAEPHVLVDYCNGALNNLPLF